MVTMREHVGWISTIFLLLTSSALGQSWNKQVLFEHPVSLNCSDPKYVGPTQFTYWLDPNGNIVNENYKETYYFFQGSGLKTGNISASAYHLNISHVLESHFGVYFCVFTQNGNPVSLKRGINVNGPYFGNLWEKYRDNTIIGCSSAGIFLVLVLILTLIYIFRLGGPRPINVVVKDLKEKARARRNAKISAEVMASDQPESSTVHTLTKQAIPEQVVDITSSTAINMDPVSTLPGQTLATVTKEEVANIQAVTGKQLDAAALAAVAKEQEAAHAQTAL